MSLTRLQTRLCTHDCKAQTSKDIKGLGRTEEDKSGRKRTSKDGKGLVRTKEDK